MQFYKDEPALDNDNGIIDFPGDNNNSNLFKFNNNNNEKKQDKKTTMGQKCLNNGSSKITEYVLGEHLKCL